MNDPLMLALALIATGLAVAGLVPAPPGRISRLLADAGAQRDPPWAPSGIRPRLALWQRRLLRLIGPRPHAPPLRQRLMIGGAFGVVAMLAARLLLSDNGTVALIAGPFCCLLTMIILGWAELPAARRRRERLIQDLPQTLELLASAMEAGLPLRAAVREVLAVTDGPLAEELAAVVHAVDLGRPESDAWRALRDHPQLGHISIDLARSVDSGTMLVAVLRRYATLARRDRQGALEARARTVGVKSVPPLMVCFVPAFLLVCVVPTVVSALQHAIG